MLKNYKLKFSSNGSKLNGSNKLADMTLTELQEIAIKQQQQIEINQQLLMAKEKRLKVLKMEEQRNAQLALLSQSDNLSSNQVNSKTVENSSKLDSLKQNVLGQELKIFKLKELRNQILKHKLSNSNMSSELDLIKSLFAKKERELCDAVKNVSELQKQIDQLRKIKTFTTQGPNANSKQNGQQNVSASELEKLKQELQIRNKLNDQQSKKIMQQHDLFNQKQIEVLALDKRITELQNRISSKKILGDQINQGYNNINNNINLGNQVHGTKPVNFIVQQKFSLNEQEFVDEETENYGGQAHNIHSQYRNNNGQEENEASGENLRHSNGSNTGFSPSKPNAKFATKQEIANTYMNKFGSEAYQRYQMNSIKSLQQQQTSKNVKLKIF